MIGGLALRLHLTPLYPFVSLAMTFKLDTTRDQLRSSIMASQRLPDGRLVYLHCSSIFSGANALVRKAKKVSQLLQTHRASINTLTREFTVSDIATVAKELLEEQIFESQPRARLRFPELFQPSETREAEREASEEEAIRIEAEAAQDLVLTSDDEGGDEGRDFEQGEQHAELDEDLEDEAEAPANLQTGADESW